MEKIDTITLQDKSRDKNRLTAIVSILTAAALLVADLYVMVNLPGMIPLIAVITAGLLAGVYVFVNAVLREINRSKEETKEQYENIFKSEKASYILLKKAFEQLEELESKSGGNHTSEDIITAQKAIAKVTISRNRENADALLNSNDKMLEKIFDFEEKLGSSQSELLDRQRSAIDDSMRELQESLKSEFAKAVSDLKGMQFAAAAVPAAVPEPAATPENMILPKEEELPLIEEETPEEPILEEGLTDAFSLTEDLTLPEEPILGEGLTDAFSLTEDLTLPEEPILEEGLTDAFSLTEDLTLPEEPILGEEIPLIEEETPEEPILEEGLTDAFSLTEDLTLPEEPILGEGLTDAFSLTEDLTLPEEPILGEEIPLIEEEMPEEQPEEGLSDGLDLGLDLDFGLDLGVDAGQEAAEEEPILEPEPTPEPVPTPAPIAESEPTPKPAAAPAPGLSDPHKMMTPDEIAALLANM